MIPPPQAPASFLNRFAVAVTFCATFFLAPAAFAELGGDNPTGIAGQFNGNITTAGSYDPYTGNAMRSITDLAVAGGVGAYPLALTRTLITRGPDDAAPGAAHSGFGLAGNWRNSYQWAIDEEVVADPTNGGLVTPEIYVVHYPDGRRIIFEHDANSSDPYFRAGPGIGDRFQQLAPEEADCYLVLPDGAKVHFQAVATPDEVNHTLTFDYILLSIIDPYGKVTTITGGTDEQGNAEKNITEPAGRTLSLIYGTGPAGDSVITKVEERLDGPTGAISRTVTYTYSSYQEGSTTYSALTSVDYFGDPTLTAHYTYQDSNATNIQDRPLISTCDDSMYAGPMKRIAYKFKAGGDYGQILSENYYDGTAIGSAISTLAADQVNQTRTETRGDGAARTFTYSGGFLQSWTDFLGKGLSQGHDAKGYVNSFTDQNSHTTSALYH